jgi:hypothetical protein
MSGLPVSDGPASRPVYMHRVTDVVHPIPKHKTLTPNIPTANIAALNDHMASRSPITCHGIVYIADINAVCILAHGTLQSSMHLPGSRVLESRFACKNTAF